MAKARVYLGWVDYTAKVNFDGGDLVATFEREAWAKRFAESNAHCAGMVIIWVVVVGKCKTSSEIGDDDTVTVYVDGKEVGLCFCNHRVYISTDTAKKIDGGIYEEL